MATLKRFHDLSNFVADKERMKDLPRGKGNAPKWDLGRVQFNAERKALVATDGRIAVMAHVEGNGCPTAVLPNDTIAAAVGKLKPGTTVELTAGNSDGTVLLGKTNVKHDKAADFPNVFGVIPKTEPDTIFCLGPELLQKIADHAHAANAAGVYFCLRTVQNRQLGIRGEDQSKDDSSVAQSFFYYPRDAKDDYEAEPVTGLIMPVTYGPAEHVRKGIARVSGQFDDSAPKTKTVQLSKGGKSSPVDAPSASRPSKSAKPSPAIKLHPGKPVGTKPPASGTANIADLLQKAETAIKNCKANNSPGFRASAKRMLNAVLATASGKDLARAKQLSEQLAALPTTVFKNK